MSSVVSAIGLETASTSAQFFLVNFLGISCFLEKCSVRHGLGLCQPYTPPNPKGSTDFPRERATHGGTHTAPAIWARSLAGPGTVATRNAWHVGLPASTTSTCRMASSPAPWFALKCAGWTLKTARAIYNDRGTLKCAAKCEYNCRFG